VIRWFRAAGRAREIRTADGPSAIATVTQRASRGTTARAAAGMGAITALSRTLGFVRVLVVAAVLGTTYLGNAFQSANLVSNVLFELLAAGALSAVLVPTFVNLLERGDRRGAEEVAGGVLGVAITVLGIISALGVIGAPVFARLLTAGVDPEVAADQQALVTYLLRFFVPQVMLYAAGTIAMAVLYAQRRFAITAAAPIGNTVVMVACLWAFRLAAGPDPGLDLGTGERLLLAAAGTGGVVAFVGSLLLATAATGFRLRPRWPRGDHRVFAALRQAGWGVALHTAQGLMLGVAVIAGSVVEGGVVAYHVGWVFFLAPYGILAQPIFTALQPEMVSEARDAGLERVGTSLRWGMERIALFVLPVAAAMVALALPAMRVVSFGEVTQAGTRLLAAAFAGLGVGLFSYGVFQLFARGYYVLGDSRTPGVVALLCAAAGVMTMTAGTILVDGAALVGVLGLGHSAAYTLGAIILGAGLARRTGVSLWSAAVARMAVVVCVVGLAAWAAAKWLLGDDPSRLADIVTLGLVGGAGAAVVLAGYIVLGVPGALASRQSVPFGRRAPSERSSEVVP
jgi:putative peptidoglycan lipid II flippase